MKKETQLLITLIISCFLFFGLGMIIGQHLYKAPSKTTAKVSDSIVVVVKMDSITKALPAVPNDTILLQVMKKHHIKHPKVVLAQAKLETGHYTSHVFKCKNNLFGLYNSSSRDYYSFKNWEHSIKFYKDVIQSKYQGGSYYNFLQDIGYAEDKRYISKLKEIVKTI